MRGFSWLVCFLRNHKPYVVMGAEVEPGVFVGQAWRYCGRCGRELPGTEPQVDDRRKI
jgi:hypothetical protein